MKVFDLESIYYASVAMIFSVHKLFLCVFHDWINLHAASVICYMN